MQAHAPEGRLLRVNWFLSSFALLAFLATAAMLVVVDRSGQAMVAWIARALQHRRGIDRVQALLLRVESAQRGYLITRDRAYLPGMRDADAALDAALDRLHADLIDDAESVAAVQRLETLVRERQQRLASGIAIAQQGREREAFEFVTAGGGRILMEQVDALVAGLDAREAERLAAYEASLASQRAWHAGLVSVLVGLAVLIAGLAIWYWRRLARAEELVRLCAWSKTVQHDGEWMTFEAYLLRRFGVRVSHGISPECLARLEDEVRDGAPPR